MNGLGSRVTAWRTCLAIIAPAFFLLGCVERSEGVVTHIDMQAQQIAIARDGAAVIFRVKDAAMLTSLNNGDKVRFSYQPVGRNLTIVNLGMKK